MPMVAICVDGDELAESVDTAFKLLEAAVSWRVVHTVT